VTGRWFSPDPPVFSTNKIDRHDIADILLKVTLTSFNNQIFLSFQCSSAKPTTIRLGPQRPLTKLSNIYKISIEGTYDITSIATDSDEIKTLNTDLIDEQ
jgi:hypothetical protein